MKVHAILITQNQSQRKIFFKPRKEALKKTEKIYVIIYRNKKLSMRAVFSPETKQQRNTFKELKEKKQTSVNLEFYTETNNK